MQKKERLSLHSLSLTGSTLTHSPRLFPCSLSPSLSLFLEQGSLTPAFSVRGTLTEKEERSA